jgi:SDR family mycofactocin-dependent oxidoreductase
VRLAEEGADIIALDICAQIDSVEYPMATPEDLARTAELVQDAGRRIVVGQADVRDPDALHAIVDKGVRELGRLDCVSANAGIMPMVGEAAKQRQAWIDAVDVLLSGVYYTVEACLPVLLAQDQGGSIVLTSSAAGLKGPTRGLEGLTPGYFGYVAAKHGVVGLMRMYANALAPRSIRVNSVHPTAVNTPMILNPQFDAWAADVPWLGVASGNALPVARVEPVDVSNALVYLFSDEARYVTGITMPVDAGCTVL